MIVLLIQMEQVSVTFQSIQKVEALKNITLTVQEGEWINILGPSGSGKTTLLNVIGGMEKVTTGTILVGGQDITKFTNEQLQKYRREMVGYIFQDFRLFDQYTVLENVILPQLPYKKLHEIEEKAKEILKSLHMSHRIHALPGELSGGEKQRTAIARALLNNPRILLCDEPTGNLDLENKQAILSILDECQKKGITILMVSHDLDISKWGTRQYNLRDGQLLE